MLQRCTNVNNARYYDYGAKGITVCPEWSSFPAFLKDMGPKPTKNHQLGRIRVTEGYTPANCRWLTRKQQGILRQATHKGWTKVVDTRP